MKRRLLDWLACPKCAGAFSLAATETKGDETREGELICLGCSARYPVVRGIPRLLPPALSAEALATAQAFGYEWTRFAEIRPEYEG